MSSLSWHTIIQADFSSYNETLYFNGTKYTVTYAIVSQKIFVQDPYTSSYGLVILASMIRAPLKLTSPAISNDNSDLKSSIEPLVGDFDYIDDCRE